MTPAEFEPYRLNYASIDKQHLELFNHMERIVEYYSGHYDKEVMLRLGQEFESLIVAHFDHESALMREMQYDVLNPNKYNAHELEHKYTLSEIRGFSLRQIIDFDDPYPIKYISDILAHHIVNHDKVFIDWYFAQKAGL